MAGKGGNMPGAGRPKGSKNKSTIEVMSLAKTHSMEAIKKLVELMNDPSVPAATQRAAANDILDRAYGKPTQAITNPDGSKLFPETIEIVIVSPEDK